MINAPFNEALINKQSFRAQRDWTTWFQQVTTICFAVQSSGPTTSRPKQNVWVGRTYFDTTLNKPIWVKTVLATAPYTVTWVDATGTTV